MSNFESGPVLLNDDGKQLRLEDAAKQVNVSGWSCAKCDRFYGNHEGAERAARYCCHTDAPCECGARKKRHQVACANCHHKAKVKRWDAIEQVGSPEPAADCPWALLDGDTYFFDLDSFLEHCAEHKIKPSEIFPVLCKPHNPPEFNLSEWLDDYLPGEEHEMPGDPDEIRAVEKAVDDFVTKHSPFSWYPDRSRRPCDATLARLDKEYADFVSNDDGPFDDQEVSNGNPSA